MVRSIFACAALALFGLVQVASAQSYEDFTLDQQISSSFASPIVAVQVSSGSLAEAKADCTEVAGCIAVLYSQASETGFLLSYNPDGTTDVPSGFSSLSWRYDATSGPVCNSVTNVFVDASGNCLCLEVLEVRDTNFGCTRVPLIPSGIVERRSKRMARNHIMPGRPAAPAY